MATTMKFLQFLTSLNRDTVVLASSERVARHLRLQAALMRAAGGAKAWFAEEKIQTITNWIEESWLSTLPDQQLLLPIQELALTKSVVDKSGLLPANLLSSTSTARKVAKAHSLVCKYNIPVDGDRFRFKAEYEAFAAWHKAILQECASTDVVFRCHLAGMLTKAFSGGELPVPKRIIVVGMVEVNAAETILFSLLSDLGAEVMFSETESLCPSPTLKRTGTQVDEYALVAEWVNSVLLPYKDAPLAAPSVAILVPDVRTYQAPLVEALALRVAPALYCADRDTTHRAPWDISSGATLGSKPIIRAAMDILSLHPREADFETFSRVLRSKFIGGSVGESSSRALLDIWLRENQGLSMSGLDLLRAVGAFKGDAASDFHHRYGSVLKNLVEGEDSRLPSAWAEQFIATLKTIGWPGRSDLDSASFQALKSWDEALTTFRTLDQQLGRVGYQAGYMWFREIVDTRQFQPRINHVAPVSILGYEDAIGLSFDEVWVVGATNMVLPLPAEPSPFLPLEMQVNAGIPSASSDLALAHATKVLEGLHALSNKITISCPSHSEKGSAIGASELIGAWPVCIEESTDRGQFIESMAGHLNREVYTQELVPPVSATELTTLRGGVSVFKDFANAPFFAFARARLQATEFPNPVIGLDYRIQGIMLHKVLELFWAITQNSWSLKALSDDQLQTRIQSCVEDAATELLNKLVWRYGARIIRLECARLVSLAAEFIVFQKSWANEFEVLGNEESYEIEVGGVPLKIQLDCRLRVFLDEDRKESRILVVDYKSGASTKMFGLNAETLVEPQLPIYATQIDFPARNLDPVDGVALAQVSSAGLKLHIRSNFTAGMEESRRPSKSDVNTEAAWLSQQQAWDQVLQEMAAGFLSGEADVEVETVAKTMGYEYLAPLTK